MTDRSSVALRTLGSRQTLLGAQNSLQSVNTWTLDDGARCYVTATHAEWQLHKDSTAAPDGSTIIAPASGPGRWIVDSLAEGSVRAFVGNYYVDPDFSGIQTGSQSNPFTTIAAAFAFGSASGVTNGTIVLAPRNIVENVTFPTVGSWDLVGVVSPGGAAATVITGNVNLSVTAAASRTLRDIQIIGNVTGNSSGGLQRLAFESVVVSGTTTLTISGAGSVRLGTLGGIPVQSAGSNGSYTFFIGAVSVQGIVYSYTAAFQDTLACSGICVFSNTSFGGAITTTAHVASDNQLVFESCLAANITINISQSVSGRLALVNGIDTNFDNATFHFTGAGINIFNLDAYSAQTFIQHGATVTGTVVGGVGTMRRQRLTAQVDNLGAGLLALRCPIPQMRVNGTLTLVTPGTSGSAVLNIGYTDSLGVARTKPVTPALNIAGSAGDEAQGSLLFTQDGSAGFFYSVTGIVTPGALSYNLGIGIEPGI